MGTTRPPGPPAGGPGRPAEPAHHVRGAQAGAPNPVGLVVVATAGLVAAVVTFGIFLPALGALGDAATRDPATLPATISVCGRDWTRDPLARELGRDEVFARTEAEPIVVEVSLTAPCPAAVGSGAGMATTVFVRTGADAYVGYDLRDGP